MADKYRRDPTGKRGLLDQNSVWAVDCPQCKQPQGSGCVRTSYGRPMLDQPVNEHARRVARFNRPLVKKVYVTWFESNRGRH
jgi:hypothetical protein